MNIERARKLPVIDQRKSVSYSELLAFRHCQWKWHLDYELGGRTNFDTVGFSFGDAIHAASELLLHRDPERRVGVDAALERFDVRLDERLAKVPEDQKIDEKGKALFSREDMSAVARRILTDLSSAGEITRGMVLVNELKIQEPIDRTDGRAIMFKGFVDLIFSAPAPNRKNKTILYICDFKSCTWGWGADKKRDKIVHAQALLYKHFVCKMLDLNPADVRTAFILLKKTAKVGTNTVEFFQPSSGPKAMEEAVAFMQETITAMGSDELTKNRESCKSRWGDCPYLNTEKCTGSV